MNTLFKRILKSTCLSYMISSFIINFVTWLFSYNEQQSRMLEIWANIIIFAICLIICSIVVYKGRKKEKNAKYIAHFASVTAIIYTLSTTVINIIQYIIKKENFWNGYTLLILLLFSIVSSFLMLKVKFKNYLVLSILHFFIIGIFYYIIFVVKAGYTNGNSLLISLSIYSVIYIALTIVYYLITKKKRKKQNSEKNYNNLFS
ncbi:MAG: hypothetical protein J6A53_07710 [Clostridia bacterium]|nr:hypothetical protein [Clostridia bacterium]